MCVQSYLTDSDITAFSNQFPRHEEFEDSIESATDDQVRWWLNSLGVSDLDIEYREDLLNESMRSIAQEMLDAGHEFIIN